MKTISHCLLPTCGIRNIVDSSLVMCILVRAFKSLASLPVLGHTQLSILILHLCTTTNINIWARRTLVMRAASNV